MGVSEGFVVLDELQNGGGIGGLLKGLADVGVLEELGDAGHGVEVLLELALRHEEEDHEADRLAVECIEGDTTAGATQGGDGLGNAIGSGVGDADAVADAGAHGLFALTDHGADAGAVGWVNRVGFDELVEELIYGLPTVGGSQLGNDAVLAEEGGEWLVHKSGFNGCVSIGRWRI